MRKYDFIQLFFSKLYKTTEQTGYDLNFDFFDQLKRIVGLIWRVVHSQSSLANILMENKSIKSRLCLASLTSLTCLQIYYSIGEWQLQLLPRGIN